MNTTKVRLDLEERTITVIESDDPQVRVGRVERFDVDVLEAIQRLHDPEGEPCPQST